MLKVFEGIRNINNFVFVEAEYSSSNLNAIENKKLVELYDDNYHYFCYRVGTKVSVSQGGRYIGNCGVHGIYEYDREDGTLVKTEFKYQDDHVESLLKSNIYNTVRGLMYEK